MKRTYFISGHRNLSEEKFNAFYKPAIIRASQDPESAFVVAECKGVDTMAQNLLAEILKAEEHHRVTVYHMLEKPRYLASLGFKTCGGYGDDVSRDSAMTQGSDEDIAFIEKGRWTSGTAQNILRRYEI